MLDLLGVYLDSVKNEVCYQKVEGSHYVEGVYTPFFEKQVAIAVSTFFCGLWTVEAVNNWTACSSFPDFSCWDTVRPVEPQTTFQQAILILGKLHRVPVLQASSIIGIFSQSGSEMEP